ncbi:putative phosphoesterase [Deinococcus sp. HSC-46F16]|uniref:metallophosphoesterase family protein n=1 Tax=Deinococcus sp. HSC-46F16 TaxID=2910968 RepID=UPI0020A1CEC6|nr:metallophosphoesterase family protein [Deinococcus sp. HSC-46F16]MCP2013802.1 putative phosphoesterase [Deinococcus sp. HSC-46F16]
MRVLVLSDTHGLLRPEVLPLAAQADAVLHAGDVGKMDVLEALRATSPGPVHAVRGNVDRSPPLSGLPETALLELGGIWVYLLHDLSALDLSPVAAGGQVVISGHTHQPRREEREGVLYLNPGSVGPRRFRLPVACAWLHLERGSVRAEPLVLAP